MLFGALQEDPITSGIGQRPAAGKEAVRLAVTLGDVRGVGPELASAAAEALKTEADRPQLVFVGPSGTVADLGADEFIPVGEWRGGGDLEAGRFAGLAISKAIQIIQAGEADALVTTPIDKSALNAAGFHYPGHTEYLADLCKAKQSCMLMAAEQTPLGGPLRIALATTHIPLKNVPAALTIRCVVDRTVMVAAGLRHGWGLSNPRIGLCALNPHASDGGLFGNEEAEILAPALEELQDQGIDVKGPIPADTIFLRALAGEFDAVLVPYHDVGMATFKTVAFGRGVNVTLGLPFPRTSPDHGTAMDIAGKGQVRTDSMMEAVRLATKLSWRWTRLPW